MKLNSKCPKCSSEEIYKNDSVIDMGDYNAPWDASIGYKKGIFGGQFGKLESYVCGKCGYVEYYVKNPSELSDPENKGISKVTKQ